MPRRLRDRPVRIAGGLGDTTSKTDARLMPPPTQSTSKQHRAVGRLQSDASTASRSSSEGEGQSSRNRRPFPRAQATSNSSSSENDVTSPARPSSAARPLRRSRSESRASPPSTNTGRNGREQQRRTQSENRTAVKHLQEIRALQQSTRLLIPKLPFARVIREVLMEYRHQRLRITGDALMALQEASEAYAVQLFEDSYRCTLHRNRVTLMPKDMQLTLYMRHGR